MIPCPHPARCGLQPGGRHRAGSVAAAECASITRGDMPAHRPHPAAVRATSPTHSAVVDQYPFAGRSNRSFDGRVHERRHNPQTGGFVDLQFDASNDDLIRISHQTSPPSGDTTAVWYTVPPDGSASVWERDATFGVSEWWIDGYTPVNNLDGFAFERRDAAGNVVEALTANELGENGED